MTKFSHKNRGYISIISKNMDYIGYFDIFIFLNIAMFANPGLTTREDSLTISVGMLEAEERQSLSKSP